MENSSLLNGRILRRQRLFPTLILAHRTNSLLDLRLYHRRSFESELFFLKN
jgi:hypothetical protein